MIKLAEYRVSGHVFERIMHETHVPFIYEAQTPVLGRPGDAGICGGFLSHSDGSGGSESAPRR